MKRGRMLLLGALGVAVAIQLVPYGHGRTNPAVTAEPGWDSPRTRELFFRACKDCHSNRTEWPWYASIAPASWLARWDVDAGRSHLNVSEWGREESHADEAAEQVRKGEMPLWYYLPLHPRARLSEQEAAELIAGLERTFGDSAGEAEAHSHESGAAHSRGGDHEH